MGLTSRFPRSGFKKVDLLALASVAQLVGSSSCDWKVVGLISGQGTYLGCGFHPQSLTPQSRCIREAADQCFSLELMFLSFSLPLSLKAMKKKMSLGENKKGGLDL